jgi:hypothetical protein
MMVRGMVNGNSQPNPGTPQNTYPAAVFCGSTVDNEQRIKAEKMLYSHDTGFLCQGWP